MKPQKQLFRHKPAEGVYGDCYRTAIATVLDMDASDVPHFMDASAAGFDPDKAHDKAEAWLNARGMATVNVLFDGSVPLREVLSTVSACNPRGRPVFILGGRSRNDVNHSVVCADGRIVCDPSQDNSGIIGPCDDGFYWLTFFGSLLATNIPGKRCRPMAAIEREHLEAAASTLLDAIAKHGGDRRELQIMIGTGELHAYVPYPEVQWTFPKPVSVSGYPVEWHFGDAAAPREAAA